jgi:catechol 2,3-dioxygenase-like lactoylglutathione lyase family enzyme
MRARIRYIALLSDSPDDQARFYSRYLELQELGRSNEGDVSMTDGFFNITFLKRRPEIQDHRNEIGLHHIGLEVPSIAEVEERYRALRPNMPILDEPGGLHFGERRIFDPEGTAISLSERPFGVEKIEERLPRIRHIAYNALWPEGVHNFFVLMFGFRELEASFERREQGRLNRFSGDGSTNFAIHPFFNKSDGHQPRYGVNHFGFLVRDVGAKVTELMDEAPAEKRPATRPYAEYRFKDPDENMADLSQSKGWQVDVGRWESAA